MPLVSYTTDTSRKSTYHSEFIHSQCLCCEMNRTLEHLAYIIKVCNTTAVQKWATALPGYNDFLLPI